MLIYSRLLYRLCVDQTENVIEHPVRGAFRDQVEGLHEHLGVLFLIDL